MREILTPTEIEIRAKRAGLTMRDVCQRAKPPIAAATFSRWKHDKLSISLDIFLRLWEASAPPEPKR
jgi:hypothetical protein